MATRAAHPETKACTLAGQPGIVGIGRSFSGNPDARLGSPRRELVAVDARAAPAAPARTSPSRLSGSARRAGGANRPAFWTARRCLVHARAEPPGACIVHAARLTGPARGGWTSR